MGYLRRASDVRALGAQFREDDVDALLVDRAQRGVGKAQAYPAVLAFDPETAPLQVRHEAALGLVVGVGNVVAHHRALSRDDVASSHGSLLRLLLGRPEAEKPLIIAEIESWSQGKLTRRRRV